MLQSRQRHLLALLDALGGDIGNVDFQKLLFLDCTELSPPPYEFVPYKFGAFSFTSYADRRKLAERHLVTDGDHWRITSAGRRALGAQIDTFALTFARATASLRGNALIADTYRRFPFYATRSEIAATVLQGDSATLQRIDNARKPAIGGLFTIGYEGLSLEGYLNRLLTAGVTVLCDVRRNPLSRKYGFSKRTLANGCHGVGIRYEHLPELGIDSIERKSLETQADYDALFTRYERDWLPNQGDAIAAIGDWIVTGDGVALTCYEHQPAQCHRRCVAEALRRSVKTGPIRHL
jgi:hypothetical protein